MELSQEEKDRIIAEEKLRMETRRDFVKEHFGGFHGMGHWRGEWRGYGCHGHHLGFGFLRILVLALAIFGLFHLCHRQACGWAPGNNGYIASPAPQSAPALQAPPKN